jgi:hypothetical protein
VATDSAATAACIVHPAGRGPISRKTWCHTLPPDAWVQDLAVPFAVPFMALAEPWRRVDRRRPPEDGGRLGAGGVVGVKAALELLRCLVVLKGRPRLRLCSAPAAWNLELASRLPSNLPSSTWSISASRPCRTNARGPGRNLEPPTGSKR